MRKTGQTILLKGNFILVDLNIIFIDRLTLKSPNTTAADDKYCDFFSFERNKV